MASSLIRRATRDEKGSVIVCANSVVRRVEFFMSVAKNKGFFITAESQRENVGQSKITSSEWLCASLEAFSLSPFQRKMTLAAV